MLKHFLYKLATDKPKGGAIAIVQFILWLLSLTYAFLIMIRRLFYRIGILKQQKLLRPVISIGNLTVGGVGKTPLVEYVARNVKKNERTPVVLTRGYMERGTDSDDQASDEAVMLQNALSDVPVLVGADRVKSAKTYLEHNIADVFILDDGFQHLRIIRDLDIVVIDATNPWGNGFLLPRGVLRESCSALKRAHIFVLTKTNLAVENIQKIKDDLTAINSKALIVDSIHQSICFIDERSGETLSLESIQNQNICAVSSIGAPESFEQTLMTLGADLWKHFTFIDHHRFTQKDVQTIVKLCRDHRISTIVTTEKDIVKLRHFYDLFPGPIHLWTLKIKIVITKGEDQFLERIHRIL